MLKVFLSIIIIFSLYGCSYRLPLTTIPTNKELFTNYNLNEEKIASVGEEIIEIELDEVMDIYIVLFDYKPPYVPSFDYYPYLFKGDLFIAAAKISNNDDDLCVLKFEGKKEDIQQLIAKRNLFINIYSNGKINRGWIYKSGVVPLQDKWTKEKLFRKLDNPIKIKSKFRIQILYSGMIGNTVRAIYREFIEDLARPSFYQELQYNLDISKIISYKSIKIEIIEATNSYIKYRVLQDDGLHWFPK